MAFRGGENPDWGSEPESGFQFRFGFRFLGESEGVPAPLRSAWGVTALPVAGVLPWTGVPLGALF